jgi:hypothetical protein
MCSHKKFSRAIKHIQQKTHEVPDNISIMDVPPEVIIWVITVSIFVLNQENACT